MASVDVLFLVSAKLVGDESCKRHHGEVVSLRVNSKQRGEEPKDGRRNSETERDRERERALKKRSELLYSI